MVSRHVFQLAKRYFKLSISIYLSVYKLSKSNPLTTDTTSIKYNTGFHDKARDNTLNSIFMNTQENVYSKQK